MIRGIEQCSEVSSGAYLRDARTGYDRTISRKAYEERWGENFQLMKPTRSVIVSRREIPETQLVKNGDGKIIRISNAPLSGHR